MHSVYLYTLNFVVSKLISHFLRIGNYDMFLHFQYVVYCTSFIKEIKQQLF